MNLEISTDPDRLDIDLIHQFLAHDSYWAEGIPHDVVARALAHSLCFGAYLHGEQVGLARVITDRATFAYVTDVFVLASFRGQGVGKALVQAVTDHPDLQGLRMMLLFTRDAHGLYAQYGFNVFPHPDRIMIRRGIDGYEPQPVQTDPTE